jgi:hypothetical protein
MWWRGSELPLPPYTATRFLNVGPDARFIGSRACAECHQRNHQSYLLTEHSRALSDLDLKAEPADGAFVHKRTGRSYRVHRRDGEFRHEEVLRFADGREIGRSDVPMRYLVGSGHFARTYLAETDGFLHESPITWYTAKKSWAMSPGYDTGFWGFERPVVVGCLACHAGRVEAVPGTVQRIVLHELAIGCESCHGPGSLHQELRGTGRVIAADEDLTIVNPGKLSRPLQEAICAACHLNGPALVPLRGRQRTDFRPGRPLTDYRIDYRFDADNEHMTVVGHIEQLRRSACYQKSEELTCTTCHDLHARKRPEDMVAFYRQKCLDCHGTQACGLTITERVKQEPRDHCVACHMPRGDTDIPHVSFTHHRIGRHRAAERSTPEQAPELVPTDDVARIPAIDRQRNLGLAYLQAMRDPTYPEFAGAFRSRARQVLGEVYARGLRDPETTSGLAEANWGEDLARSAAFAREAIEANGATPEARASALLILASAQMQDGNFASAQGHLEVLVKMRRYAEDWRLLGLCYLQTQGPQKAANALEHALTIRPFQVDIHGALADVYRDQGDMLRSEAAAAKAQELRRLRQD